MGKVYKVESEGQIIELIMKLYEYIAMYDIGPTDSDVLNTSASDVANTSALIVMIKSPDNVDRDEISITEWNNKINRIIDHVGTFIDKFDYIHTSIDRSNYPVISVIIDIDDWKYIDACTMNRLISYSKNTVSMEAYTAITNINGEMENFENVHNVLSVDMEKGSRPMLMMDISKEIWRFVPCSIESHSEVIIFLTRYYKYIKGALEYVYDDDVKPYMSITACNEESGKLMSYLVDAFFEPFIHGITVSWVNEDIPDSLIYTRES